jgi:hypothetical protein
MNGNAEGPGRESDLRSARRERIKALLRRVKTEADVEPARRELADLLGSVPAEEIAAIEQDLLAGGMPVGDLHRMCDAHARVLGDVVTPPDPGLPPYHPVEAYLAENRAIAAAAERFAAVCRAAAGGTMDAAAAGEALDDLARVETHYVRKENQLFPALERNGFSGPSKVMWSVHNEIRDWIRVCRFAIGQSDAAQLADQGLHLVRMVTEMIAKEEKILYPTALRLLKEEEWRAIRAGDDHIGYVFIAPPPAWPAGSGAPAAEASVPPPSAVGAIPLNMGALTPEQIDRMLTALPVEISFVDENDQVRYYSGHEHRIFPRSPGVIGREVRNCHPPKSVHMVEAILKSFREGTRTEASFWMTYQGRFILIRYYPVRAEDGRYLGTIEVSQDVTDVRSLTGERRILDWD